jgi:muramoyltetrapeptide carboxypeptidase
VIFRVPPAIPRGGRIAVIAPGSALRDPDAVRAGMEQIAAWGYEPVPGRSLFARAGDLAGRDAARLDDLRRALTDPAIDAAWAARGGWGTARLLHGLDLRALARRPRWLIGFSDLTALQLALHARGVASWYAPCVADLADRRRYRAADLRAMLSAPEAPRTLRGRRFAGPGRRAVGPLAGGCLSLLAAVAGTPWQPDLRGAVVFLEDVGEAPYRVDRLLWQVRAAGILDGIAGLALGQFTACDPPPGRPSRTLAAVLREHAEALGVPVLAGLPIGHGPRARAVPIGYRATLDPHAGTLVLRAPR